MMWDSSSDLKIVDWSSLVSLLTDMGNWIGIALLLKNLSFSVQTNSS